MTSDTRTSNWKYLVPQIYSACVATSFYLILSSSLAFPTFLMPQLEHPDSDIKVTISQSSWTATIATMTLTIFSLLNGIFIEKIGTLNTIKLCFVPGIIGWCMVATAKDITVLLIGRFLIGLAVAFMHASTVYATEITRPDIRGSILSTIPGFVSAGLFLSNIFGYFFHWRTLAWINNIYIVIPSLLAMFLPESPIWLIHKGRLNDARKSLVKFCRFHPQPDVEAEKQFQDLLNDYKKKTENDPSSKKITTMQVVKNFMKPTGYKPMLLTIGIFFFQEATGIYIILVHTIIFFRNIENDLIDVKLIPIILSLVRLLANIVATISMKHFNKRTLIMSSCLGMALCTFLSGLFTLLLKQGTTTLTWMPIVFITIYIVCSVGGVIPIPWMITSELFPTNIRGFGNGFAQAIGNLMLSIALQNYRYLETALGGTHAIQFFFSGMSILGMIYFWLFLPETHNKKLIEIEEYFEHNWVYLRRKINVEEDDENVEEVKELKSIE